MSNDVPTGGVPPTPPSPPPPPGSFGAVPPPAETMPPQGSPPGMMPPAGPPPGYGPPPGPGMMPPPGPGMMPPGYGTPDQGYPPYYAAARPGPPGLAIAGFVCSLVGLFMVPIIFSIAGLILSIMGRKQARQQQAPTGLATAGFWISIAGLVLWGLLIVFYIILIAIAVSSGNWETTTNVIVPFMF